MSRGEVLLTGSSGIIGSVLRQGLAYDVRPFDLESGNNAGNYTQVLQCASGCTAIIHLAWDTELDNAQTPSAAYQLHQANTRNIAMAQNVLMAAAEAEIPRVVLASSIHADMPRREPGGARSPMSRRPEPDSVYGAGKVALESLGASAAREGLEVACIRFGWVSKEVKDRPPIDGPYPAGEGWLSHRDCVGLVNATLAVPEIPDDYVIVYGVSQRKPRGAHDLSNPFGWRPQDSYVA